jgi:ribonucleoside-diphosphate reductase alpha chain
MEQNMLEGAQQLNGSCIVTDPSRDTGYDIIGIQRLQDSYMREGETSPQERLAYVSEIFSSNPAHAQRLYDYSSQFWFGYATPILSFGRNNHGLPISCFLNFVHDSKSGLVDNLSETNWLSMVGGGVGVYWDVRGQDEKSVGVIPHMKIYDDSVLAYKQGTTRRGSYAMYLDIDHPDIIEFLEMRKETGDPRRKCLNLHYGVNIPDSFMKIIETSMLDASINDDWQLKDPETRKVHDTVSARDLWEKIIDLRAGQGRGEPYLHFIDTSNRSIPQYLKDQGYQIRQSNLCSEILLHTDKDKTAVCCLSSLNLDKWDEYKDNYQFFKDVMEMLDNVLEYFINNAPKEIGRAIRSAIEERSVGLGVMGFHSYLQQHNIPFDGVMAKVNNIKIFKQIRSMVDKANIEIGTERGSPKMLKGTGLRFAHTMALAPTASNALICGNVSPTIEPWRANAFRQDTMSGTFIQKNRYLDRLIHEKATMGELDYDETWIKIVQDEGSIQLVEGFTELEKEVYKTFSEIDMMWAVEHAADRQQFIDQGQSFNICIRPDISVKRLHAIHFSAWKKGVKTMYYVRSEKLANTEKVSQKVIRKRIEDDIDLAAIINDEECLACSG